MLFGGVQFPPTTPPGGCKALKELNSDDITKVYRIGPNRVGNLPCTMEGSAGDPVGSKFDSFKGIDRVPAGPTKRPATAASVPGPKAKASAKVLPKAQAKTNRTRVLKKPSCK